MFIRVVWVRVVFLWEVSRSGFLDFSLKHLLELDSTLPLLGLGGVVFLGWVVWVGPGDPLTALEHDALKPNRELDRYRRV